VTHIDRDVPAEERLLCLLLALVPSRRGMSKQEIFETVRGYREDYLTKGQSDALNKKFDRDKDELKSMGIPLTTSEPENPADAVYSISEADYEALTFSPAEISLLTAASAVWRESAHSNDAREAKMRLLAAGVDASPEMVAYAPRIDTRDVAYPVVPQLEPAAEGPTGDQGLTGKRAAVDGRARGGDRETGDEGDGLRVHDVPPRGARNDKILNTYALNKFLV
jgi:proteasome accessory factor B